MFRKRTGVFYRAHGLLAALREQVPKMRGSTGATANELRPLLALQRLLFKEISRVEHKTRRCKAILKSIVGGSDSARMTELQGRIEELRQDAFLWRCFGDAIAFMFLDKFALKQTYFNTSNTNEKQTAGFLDKEGVAAEWQVLERCHTFGAPALLSDLTNVIRHGDVCVLFGPDPFLIEVKSGSLNARGKRQRRDIRQLMSFFDTDEAHGLRGFEKIERVALDSEEITYVDAMNECLDEADRHGSAVANPEPGVYYVAIAEDGIDIGDVIDGLNLTKPWFFSLNKHKSDRDWLFYYPFVLSIRDADALLAFIRGYLYLAIFIEPAALTELATARGFTIDFEGRNEELGFILRRDGGEAKIGTPMFYRIGYEFSSPAWLVGSAMDSFDRHSGTRPPRAHPAEA